MQKPYTLTKHDLSNIKSFICRMRKSHPNLVQHIRTLGSTEGEGWYLYHHNLSQRPKCPYCKTADLSFNGFNLGYSKFCSSRCAAKYRIDSGEPNPATSPTARAKLSQKAKNRSQTNPTATEDILSKEQVGNIIDSMPFNYTQHLKHKYPKTLEMINSLSIGRTLSEKCYCWIKGISIPACPVCGQQTRYKSFQTGHCTFCSLKCQAEYNADASKQKAKSNWLPKRIEKFRDVAIPLFNVDDYKDVSTPMPYRCTKCQREFVDHIDNGGIPKCTWCYVRSQPELDIVSFLSGSFPNTEIVRSIRTITPPREIDIWIPNKQLGIEYHGLYWHSEDQVGRNLHREKRDLADAAGIQLIQIWESEWLNKQSIVKSRLLAKLGKFEKRYYARELTIREVNFSEAKDFLNSCHIQGSCTFSYGMALCHENQIVALMTVSKPRFSKHHDLELSRFCCDLNTQVVGGSEKLFKHVVDHLKPSTMVSYSDRRWNTGQMYSNLGFKQLSTTKPNYWYFRTGDLELKHRMRFAKKNLPDILESFDPSKTEWGNMQTNGWNRVWDAGSDVFVWTK